MSDIQLWKSAQSNSRDAVNLMAGEIKTGAELQSTVEKTLGKLRAATAAMEALQRNSQGLPVPRRAP